MQSVFVITVFPEGSQTLTKLGVIGFVRCMQIEATSIIGFWKLFSSLQWIGLSLSNVDFP